jgi:hypothetical protein
MTTRVLVAASSSIPAPSCTTMVMLITTTAVGDRGLRRSRPAADKGSSRGGGGRGSNCFSQDSFHCTFHHTTKRKHRQKKETAAWELGPGITLYIQVALRQAPCPHRAWQYYSYVECNTRKFGGEQINLDLKLPSKSFTL